MIPNDYALPTDRPDDIKCLPNTYDGSRVIYRPMNMNRILAGNSKDEAIAWSGLNKSNQYSYSYRDADGIEIIHQEPLLEGLCYGSHCHKITCYPYGYCPYHLKDIFGVEVRPSLQGPHSGLGLFFTKNVHHGHLIGNYEGLLLSTKAISNMYSLKSSTSQNSTLPYVCQHSYRVFDGSGFSPSFLTEDDICNKDTRNNANLYVIDSALLRSPPSFINEPEDGAQPNCVFSFDGFNNVIQVKTNRRVSSGEEATMVYAALGNKKTYKHKGGGTSETHVVGLTGLDQLEAGGQDDVTDSNSTNVKRKR